MPPRSSSAAAAATIAQARSSLGPRSAATGGFPGAVGGSARPEAISPLFDAWNQQAGIGWGTQVYSGATGLPRAFDTYREGQFGPFEPIWPVPIDRGEEPSGRPRPRRFQFPVGWNLPVGQPGTEGIKLSTFQVLRDYAELPSIPRDCIEIVKTDLLNLVKDELDGNVVPTTKAQLAMQGNKRLRRDFEKRREEVIAFLQNPDPGNYDDFEDWLNALTEDLVVLDAVAIHPLPTTGKGNGPLGSDLAALELLDGATARPLLDDWGGRPKPPNPAYQQFIWNVPRVDLMDIINLGPNATIEDLKLLNPMLEELSETVDEWRGDQLLYMRANPRSWTPYGFGPLEQGLLPAAIILARQTWQWAFFQEGSLPAVFLDPGETIANAEEARQLQEAINMLGGNLGAKHQVIVIPPGGKIMPQKDVDLTDQLDEWLAALMCMPFGLALADLGITPKVAALQSPEASRTAAQTSSDRSTRRSTIPRAKKLKRRVFDRVIQQLLGQKDMHWSWGIMEQGQTKEERISNSVALFKGSISSLDEARIANEMDSLGLKGVSDIPLIFTAKGAIPVTALLDALAVPAPPGNGDGPPALGPGPAALPPGPRDGGSNGSGGTKRPPGGVSNSDRATTPAQAAAQGSGARAQRAPTTTKALSDELEVLRRYLRKGGDPGAFRSAVIGSSALLAARGADGVGERVRLVKAAQERDDRRDGTLEAERVAVVTGLGGLVADLLRRRLAQSEFVPRAQALLRGAYRVAGEAGAEHALQSLASDAEPPDLSGGWDLRAQGQSQYLRDLATDALAGQSQAELAARAAMYGASLTAPYEEAFAATLASASDVPVFVRWRVGAADPCSLCAARDGETYALHEIPGFPGDGSFGDLCEGGPLCRCRLEMVVGGQVVSTSAQPAGARVTAMGGEVPALSGELQATREQVGEADAAADAAAAAQDEADAAVAERLRVQARERAAQRGTEPPPWAKGLLKDFSVSSPLASGFMPFDLEQAVHPLYPAPERPPYRAPVQVGRKPRKRRRKDKVRGTLTKRQANYRPGAGDERCGNCFSGDTEILTKEGRFPLKALVGSTVEVLTSARGTFWAPASVRSFGVQRLWRVEMARMGRRQVIEATSDHVWFIDHGSLRSPTRRAVMTKDLKAGDRLSMCRPPNDLARVVPSPFGIAHGFTYGDGYRERAGAGAFFAEGKDEVLLPFFFGHPVKRVSGGYRIRGLPGFFKGRPALGESKSYLLGWLAGYFAADGSVDKNGIITLSSARLGDLRFVRTVCDRLGIETGPLRTQMRLGIHGRTSALHYVTLSPHGLPPSVFLLPKHAERVRSPRRAESPWRVVKVEDAQREEEVFCAVVPTTERFTLGEYQLVHNCSMVRLLPPDFESHGCTLVKGLIDPAYTCDHWEKATAVAKGATSAPQAAEPTVQAAGIAVRAEDTGRVLMVQRALEEGDPASGAWEFPGGHIEEGETPFAAACREWSEEIGAPCPTDFGGTMGRLYGQVVGMWESPNGVYQGFTISVPREADVTINLDWPRVENPDAPTAHAKPETAAWHDVGDLHGMPALRRELAADLPRALPALRAPLRRVTKQAEGAPRMAGTSMDEGDVLEYLEEHYPDADIGWVRRCLWVTDNVLLSDVDWEHRPGGIDEGKVDDMAGKLGEGWQPHPVVLVAGDGEDHLSVADGYHRLAALSRAGQAAAQAWVGTPKPGNTGWRADVLAMQFTSSNTGPAHGDD